MKFGILSLSLSLSLLLIWSCSQYSPEKYEAPIEDTGEVTTQASAAGTITSINTKNQICNSSISQDTVHFKGCMLWLGFTDLSVKNPPKGYNMSDITQHDRLTISNFENEVSWFLMKDSVPEIDCEFQDPEWSAHPAYISTLGQHNNADDFCNEEGDYSAYAIRLQDKAILRMNQRQFNNLATPHFWVNPQVLGEDGQLADSITYDKNGFADKKSIETFFGTQQVKIAWAKKEDGLTVYWADYSSDSLVIQKIAKPKGREGWKAESPLFSPDGNFIVYNLFQTQSNYEAWVQELSPNAEPILIAEGGMDPRWWVNPWNDNLYITYVKRNNLIYTVLEDLTDSELLESGDAGATYMRPFNVPFESPQAFHSIGEETMLVNLPFKGGISPDGKYMATGTNFAYMIELR